MEDLHLKSLLIITEIAIITLPSIVVLTLFSLRNKVGKRVHIVLKGLIVTFYSLCCSYVVWAIGSVMQVDEVVLWISVSISVMVGMELVHLHLNALAKRGSELAKDLLNI